MFKSQNNNTGWALSLLTTLTLLASITTQPHRAPPSTSQQKPHYYREALAPKKIRLKHYTALKPVSGKRKAHRGRPGISKSGRSVKDIANRKARSSYYGGKGVRYNQVNKLTQYAKIGRKLNEGGDANAAAGTGAGGATPTPNTTDNKNMTTTEAPDLGTTTDDSDEPDHDFFANDEDGSGGAGDGANEKGANPYEEKKIQFLDETEGQFYLEAISFEDRYWLDFYNLMNTISSKDILNILFKNRYFFYIEIYVRLNFEFFENICLQFHLFFIIMIT